jgi:hypothetical protein
MELHRYPEVGVLPDQFGDFRWMDAHRLLRSERRLPERAGAYAVFVKEGQQLLDRLNLPAIEKPDLVSPVDGFAHVYTGCSGNLRLRMPRHFKGDTNTSSLRHTLLAGERAHGALSATGVPLDDDANVEFSLDRWISRQGLFLWWQSKDHMELEAQILATVRSPLNITLRKAGGAAKALLAMRRRHER